MRRWNLRRQGVVGRVLPSGLRRRCARRGTRARKHASRGRAPPGSASARGSSPRGRTRGSPPRGGAHGSSCRGWRRGRNRCPPCSVSTRGVRQVGSSPPCVALCLMVPLLVGCAEPSSRPPPHPSCSKDVVGARGAEACHHTLALQATDLAEAAVLCDAAGTLAIPCRSNWVSHNPAQGTRADRLAFCQDDACRLTVLKQQPARDLDASLSDCRAFAPTWMEACANSAVDAWAAQMPGQAALGQAAVRTDVDPGVLGAALGEVVRCIPTRSCTGPAAVTAACEATLRRRRDAPCPPGVTGEGRRRRASSGPP